MVRSSAIEVVTMTKFEEVSSILNKSDSADLRENCIYWLEGDKQATVNLMAGNRFATKVRRLKKQYPEDVDIFEDGKEKSKGVMIASIPVKAVKIFIPERAELTDEQRQAASDRLRRFHEMSADNDGDSE